MKKILAIITTVAITAMAGTVLAADTAYLDVAAKVISSCTMTGGNLDLETWIQSTGGVMPGSGDIKITCTKDARL